MITLKELQYVDFWASKIPMPGVEYSLSVLDKLKECYNLYNKLYKNKELNILFSNGEEINFSILDSNLCHMLGIDYKNIKSEFFDLDRKEIFGTDSTDLKSFDVLELILENADKIVEHDNDPAKRAKFINYYKSQIKSEIFNKLGGFSTFNYGAICDEQSKSLYVPSGELACPYFFTCIKLDDEAKNYIVYSLLAPTDPERFFNGHEVIIPTQMIINDQNNLKRITATPKEKMDLLLLYKNIINKYQLENKLNIMADYENMLHYSNKVEQEAKSLLLTK